ncbi:MAG: hypothetical protein COX43_00030 [Parcubacteria group bacterium CG23_combo_of_CG06-09_8_20_14_all_35_9]|nr:MAG: hypothetical protein COX43_00030 [Parcubacteria group bacterium CG23_combo_of_CG06-09_8_20_14_all_35_9]
MNLTFEIDFWSHFPEIIAMVAVIIAIIVFIEFIKITKRLFRRPELYGLDKGEIKKRWQKIEGLLKGGEGRDKYIPHFSGQKKDLGFASEARKMAIMEADKLLDHTLKAMGFGGSNLGERLKLACHKFERLRRVWWAHKIRNQLVHEANFYLNYWTAKKAVKIFKDALRELGAL